MDDIDTIKFVFVQWVGETVKPMSKAKASTHRGAIDDYFKVRPMLLSLYVDMVMELQQLDEW